MNIQKRRWIMMLVLGFCALGALWYQRVFQPELITIRGETMGTYYQVKIVDHGLGQSDHLQTEFESALVRINKSLSTWDVNSLISQYNANPEDLSVYAVDADFSTVMQVAQQVYELSNGAFNPALTPLIKFWGFDRDSDKHYWPNAQEVTAALAQSDFSSVVLSGQTIQRLKAGVGLNFSAIAKGYGVDVLAAIVEDAGFQHFLVDIGGEIRGKGQNLDAENWRIGIEQPDQTGAIVQTVAELENTAVATSGDYRNYREKDGKRFSHIIDPRSGAPINHNMASVSVRAETAMIADAWATALIVMGRAGLDVCNQQQLACYMIVREQDGFSSLQSAAW